MIDETGGPAAPDGAESATQAALNLVGRRIVSGALHYRPADVISADAVAREFGVSKAMAREVLQSLQHMQIIKIQPRHGAVVQALHEWNMLDPTVITWRLEQPTHWHVRRSLTELRNVVEPAAARLAALRAPADAHYALLHLDRELNDLGSRERFDPASRASFRDLDAQFHTTLLTASGNEAFRSLAYPVVLAMNHRIDEQWAGADNTGRRSAARPVGDVQQFPERPERVALSFHHCLALAVAQGLPDTAETFSRALLAEVDGELLTNAALRDAVLRGLDELELSIQERRTIADQLSEALERARQRRQAGRAGGGR